MPFILLITELHDWTFKFCLWGIPNSAIRTNVVKDELEELPASLFWSRYERSPKFPGD